MFVLGAIAQLVLITAVMAPMTYVAAAINLPMQDATLLAIDRALGLDWAAYVHFVDASPGARGRAQFRLRHDRLADFCHSGRAGGEAALSTDRRIHLCVRLGSGRDHDHLGAGAGDRRLSADRARSRHAQEHRSGGLSRSIARPAADPRRRTAPPRSARSRRHRDVSELSTRRPPCCSPGRCGR